MISQPPMIVQCVAATEVPTAPDDQALPAPDVAVKEIGGRDGPEPTRFGDWEKNGRCIDF